MTVHGLADHRLVQSELGEVFELFVGREHAEQALRDVLRDEPGWIGEISLVEIELSV